MADRADLRAVQRAADRHVLPLSQVVLGAAQAARDALDLADLERAAGSGSVAAVEAACDAALEAYEAALAGPAGGRKAASDEEVTGVEPVVAEAAVDGARAVDVCTTATPWPGDVHVGRGVPKAQAEKLRRQLDELPLALRVKSGLPTVRLTSEPIPGHPTAAGLMSHATQTIWVRTGMPRRSVDAVLRHEVMHAFDGGGKISVGVKEAFAKDMRTFGRRPGDALVRHYALNEREAFAQAGAHLTGRVGDRVEFAKAFPETIRATEAILRRHGII